MLHLGFPQKLSSLKRSWQQIYIKWEKINKIQKHFYLSNFFLSYPEFTPIFAHAGQHRVGSVEIKQALQREALSPCEVMEGRNCFQEKRRQCMAQSLLPGLVTKSPKHPAWHISVSQLSAFTGHHRSQQDEGHSMFDSPSLVWSAPSFRNPKNERVLHRVQVPDSSQLMWKVFSSLWWPQLCKLPLCNGFSLNTPVPVFFLWNSNMIATQWWEQSAVADHQG